MERRQFIRTSCKLCVGIAGASVISSLLTSCTSMPIYNTAYTNKQIAVPLDQFAKSNFVIVRASNLNYDIAVIKQQDGTFRSIYMQCTHADNPVEFNGNEFNCSLHGSIFSRTGEVKRGPAEKALPVLKTNAESGQVVIYLK